MARVAVLGEPVAVAGYRLAGAVVLPATGEQEIRQAWARMPDDVAVVILTARAAQVLADLLAAGSQPLTVVMPT